MPVLGVTIKPEDLQRIYFTPGDKAILRELGKRKAELAARPIQEKKRRLWMAHNDLEETRPVIFCDPENGWGEIITDYQCETPLARCYEEFLRKELFWGERMGDDRVIENVINVPYVYDETSFGLPVEIIGGENGGSYTWIPPLTDWEKLAALEPQRITVDYEKSDRLMALVGETFEGILTVRRHTDWWWSLGMTREAILLRGMQEFFYDLVDNPDEVHQLMAFLRDSNLNKIEFLEKNGLLAANANDTYVGSGGFGYTKQLMPENPDGSVKLKNMWGFLESQETLSVSPDMFEEFVFPYQKPLLDRFGLNCYGCCEPMDKRWHIVKRTPNLRRVSVSAWADKQKMADYLGADYIYSYKPRAVPLAQYHMDEDYVRKELTEVLKKARGCRLEIIMKDNNTLGHNPENAVKWCAIARELSERIWG